MSAAAAIGLHASGGGRVVTLNAEMTMAARATTTCRRLHRHGRLVIPDGAGVVWALSRQGVGGQDSGDRAGLDLLGYAAAHGWCVAFDWGVPGGDGHPAHRLPTTFPGLNLVLAVDGYQSDPAWSAIEKLNWPSNRQTLC